MASPTSTVENYLKEIYLAQERQGDQPVAMGEVARSLGVVPGTATSMIKNLARRGWAEYSPRIGVRLTDEGELVALNMIRRHRLLELFLVKTLGLDWSEIHEEAEQLEHAVSERVLDAMDAFLGRPTSDPHGDPIPSANGKMRQRKLVALSRCRVGAKAKVARITDQDSDFLQFVENQGLKPGTELTVTSRLPGADATGIALGESAPLTLGTRAAEKILVEEC
ncbi:MAG: DtxR family transcriptional regulator Mn-dependent transcriptional regulator [Puniceicoccaceae bacterium 5H]|nr:MAG: DtxR family transcriptional regulator Mn-dependent transcriptional regulator [Puniceicoccaceae bacterium 5H]